MMKHSGLLHLLSPLLAVFMLLAAIPLAAEVLVKVDNSTCVGIGSIFRGYYLNDQRLFWSGMETTFGVEASLTADIQKKLNWGLVRVLGQFFINQPSEDNKLADERRAPYLANFEKKVFEIKQLAISINWKNTALGLGKHSTLFGRHYMTNLSNSYFDYPFIRNEVISNHETGFFCRFTPGIFSLDAAITNGSEEMDTNSSKAGIVRIGIGGKNKKWALGMSAKMQDGIGSEWQKVFQNHVGIDLMGMVGCFRLSAEAIYDEYGFHRDFPLDEIYWKRSFYGRDVFLAYKKPVTGIGGYINLQYESPGSKCLLELIYSDYYPQEIGDPCHDDPIHRGIFKFRVLLASGLHAYGAALFENSRTKVELFENSPDHGFLLGMQYTL